MEQMFEQERQEELDLLKSKLSQIQQKFLNEWTGETLKNLIKHRNEQASHDVQRGQGIHFYMEYLGFVTLSLDYLSLVYLL